MRITRKIRRLSFENLSFLSAKIAEVIEMSQKGKEEPYEEIFHDKYGEGCWYLIERLWATNQKNIVDEDVIKSEKIDSPLPSYFSYKISEARAVEFNPHDFGFDSDPSYRAPLPVKASTLPGKMLYFVLEIYGNRKLTGKYPDTEARKLSGLPEKERKLVKDLLITIYIASDFTLTPAGVILSGNLWIEEKFTSYKKDDWGRLLKDYPDLLGPIEYVSEIYASTITHNFPKNRLWEIFLKMRKEEKGKGKIKKIRQNEFSKYKDPPFTIMFNPNQISKEEILLQLAIIAFQNKDMGIVDRYADSKIYEEIFIPWANRNARVNYNYVKYFIENKLLREDFWEAKSEIYKDVWLSVRNNYCIPAEGFINYINGSVKDFTKGFIRKNKMKGNQILISNIKKPLESDKDKSEEDYIGRSYFSEFDNDGSEFSENLPDYKLIDRLRNKIDKGMASQEDKKRYEALLKDYPELEELDVDISQEPFVNNKIEEPTADNLKEKNIISRKKFYSIKEISERFNCSVQNVRRLIKKNKIEIQGKGGRKDHQTVKHSDLKFIFKEKMLAIKKNDFYEELGKEMGIPKESVERKIRRLRRNKMDREGVWWSESEALKYYARKHGLKFK